LSHRRDLIDLLAGYAAEVGDDDLVARFVGFVEGHGDCLLRTCRPGHITASVWLLSDDLQRCLLTHHRKLSRWLQLGGHVDGETQVVRAALREAREESGMQRFELLSPQQRVVPIDLDVHPIPARGDEPEHLHWDVRFLLRAVPGQQLVVSEESNDLQWVERSRLAEFTDEESVLRLDRRAEDWLGRGVVAVDPEGCR
jgi:8-oxo-dGTP pyrophosphatase MutT (NUDIX family)